MYPTDLQDLRPSGCCGSSDDGEDSRGEGGGDTGEDTSVDEFSNDDDDSDSQGDVRETGDCTIQNAFCDSRPFSADTWLSDTSHCIYCLRSLL